VNASKVSPVQSGEIIAGRYRVDRVIGAGGMGVVVSATDTRLGSPVAIKFLHPDALEHAEIVARFAREAKAAVKIKSEHVARVMDVGTLENGAPFMVMEHLEGRDLYAELVEKGRLPVEDVVDFVLQACEALLEAHSLGFVHRDLKPANLFLVRSHGSPLVKVLDFGISKLNSMVGVTGSSGAVTRTASILGSPLYMSPEQMDSARNVDLRTDIWALGVICYELLAGRPPFSGESIPQLCIAVLSQTPPSLRAGGRPDVPPELESVIMRCLEKDRERRFSSISELALALARFAPPRSRISIERISSAAGVAASSPGSGRGAAVRDRSPSGAMRDSGRNPDGRDSAEAPAGATQGTWGRTASERRSGTASERRSPYLVWIGTGVTLSVAIGALLLLYGRFRTPEHALDTLASSSAVAPAAPRTAEVAPATAQVAPAPPAVVPVPVPEEARPASPAPAVPPVSTTAPYTARPRAKSKPPPAVAASSSVPKPAPAHPKPHAGDWEDER
jgi:serine/threonine protein kinase